MKRDKKGRFVKGFKHTKKFKSNMSKRYAGKNHPMFGKHHTQKTKQKIRKAKLGRPSGRKGKHHTEKTKRKLSESRKGKYTGKDNPFYGKTHTKRARELISKGNSFSKANLKCKHHIDLDKKNIAKENLLKLTNSKHQKLHRRAYNYLVEINKVDKYLNWFDKKYGLN